MFKKILIIETLDSIVLGIATSLQKNFYSEADTCKNAGSGIHKIKAALKQNIAYDLIITRLDYTHEYGEINTGETFITAARQLLPNVKIIVYTDNTNSFRIHELFHKHKINAFVAYGPDSMAEVAEAIRTLYTSGSIFISPACLPLSKNLPNLDLNDFDIELLKLLSQGKSQPEISNFLIENGMGHASISTIEKRVNKLKLQFEAINTINLIALAKDTGII